MENSKSEIDDQSNKKQSYLGWVITVSLAILVIGTSILLYGNFDNPLPDSPYEFPTITQSGKQFQMSGPTSVLSGDTHQIVGGIDELAERLKQKLEQHPDNAEGWALLARSYVELDRHREAIPAFEHAVKLIRDDPQLLVDYADALGMINGSRLNEQAAKMIQRARELDPRNVKATLLAATLAFDKKEYGQSIELWGKILTDRSIKPTLASELSGNIQEARNLRAGGTTVLASFTKKPSIPFDPSLRGIINLDSRIQNKFEPTDILFIFARAVNGPPMPVAVVRAMDVEFPYSFYLDDEHSVMPGRKLSEAGEVVVFARVSKAGDATANTGDLEGKSSTVTPGARDVQILIDAELP